METHTDIETHAYAINVCISDTIANLVFAICQLTSPGYNKLFSIFPQKPHTHTTISHATFQIISKMYSPVHSVGHVNNEIKTFDVNYITFAKSFT